MIHERKELMGGDKWSSDLILDCDHLVLTSKKLHCIWSPSDFPQKYCKTSSDWNLAPALNITRIKGSWAETCRTDKFNYYLWLHSERWLLSHNLLCYLLWILFKLRPQSTINKPLRCDSYLITVCRIQHFYLGLTIRILWNHD